MRRSRILAASTATLALLGSVAGARLSALRQTWIVDDDGGPGVHFTEIAPAVAAAEDGDLILVLAGTYSGFVVSEALAIIGEPGVVVQGQVSVQPAPGAVSLASLQVQSLEVLGCDEAVILDEVVATGGVAHWIQFVGSFVVNVEDCADVRFVDCAVAGTMGDLHHALRVLDSRVEIVTSSLQGNEGAKDDDCAGLSAFGGSGGDGMRVEGAARVHTSLAGFTGGDGGYAGAPLCNFAYAGDGGSGAVVLGSSEVVVTGGSYTGGDGGAANGSFGYSYCGDGGDGISGTGQLRRSGAKWTRGAGPAGCPDGVAVGLSNTVATPPDPTLERLSTPVSGFFGAPVTLRVRGNPGAFTRLFLGHRPQVKSNPNVEIELLLERLVTIELGDMPAKGYVDYVLPLGPEWPRELYDGGRLMIAQAACIYPGGENRRTNSVPLVLR